MNISRDIEQCQTRRVSCKTQSLISCTPSSQYAARWTFDAPPSPTSSNLPLALKMGSLSMQAGATKGRIWVNGYEIGSFWSKSFAAGAQGLQLYLIPEDYLTPSKRGNLLVLLEDYGLVGGGSVRGGVEGIEVVRVQHAWG